MGIDIDFEYILAEDRIAFAEFVTRVRMAANATGYPVSVALAPKTSDDQAGLLYEGKDYRLLGEAANQVLLMTYEWGYTYSSPMAVAPIHKVREVVEYALTRIPAEKLTLASQITDTTGLSLMKKALPPHVRSATRKRWKSPLQTMRSLNSTRFPCPPFHL